MSMIVGGVVDLLYFRCLFYVFFFFKQKTAYEMRISDWSSDVCSSDLFFEEDIIRSRADNVLLEEGELQSVHVDEQRFVGDVVFAMRGIFAHVERIVETVIPQLGNAVVGQDRKSVV